MPAKMVTIKRKGAKEAEPGGAETATVSQAAYDQIYKDKGWEIVEKKGAKASTTSQSSGSGSGSS